MTLQRPLSVLMVALFFVGAAWCGCGWGFDATPGSTCTELGGATTCMEVTEGGAVADGGSVDARPLPEAATDAGAKDSAQPMPDSSIIDSDATQDTSVPMEAASVDTGAPPDTGTPKEAGPPCGALYETCCSGPVPCTGQNICMDTYGVHQCEPLPIYCTTTNDPCAGIVSCGGGWSMSCDIASLLGSNLGGQDSDIGGTYSPSLCWQPTNLHGCNGTFYEYCCP